jgi:hypothetical protein
MGLVLSQQAKALSFLAHKPCQKITSDYVRSKPESAPEKYTQRTNMGSLSESGAGRFPTIANHMYFFPLATGTDQIKHKLTAGLIDVADGAQPFAFALGTLNDEQLEETLRPLERRLAGKIGLHSGKI